LLQLRLIPREFMPPDHPISPHLQVYRLPMAAVLSISHRIMGAFLTGGLIAIAFLIASAAYAPELWSCVMGILAHPLGMLVLLGLSFALIFHLCTGIRHLVWDTGSGLEMKAVRFSNWVVLSGSVVLTGAFWVWVWL